jgi:hypothetical protein
MASVKNKSKSRLDFQNKGSTPEATIGRAEIQKTHFNLGTTKLDYVSYAGGTMIEHPITKESLIETDKNRKQAIDQMRTANFKIPNQQNLATGKSTYKDKISDATAENQLAGQSAQLLSNLKKASINIGRKGQPLDSATEQAEQFLAPQNDAERKNDVHHNAEMKKYLKNHHFDLGSKNANRISLNALGPQSVLTAPQSGSNHYLNQQYNRSVQETVKLQKEQRAHHFEMGYEFRPSTSGTAQVGLQKHLSQQL